MKTWQFLRRWCFDGYYLLPMFILSCLAFNSWNGKHYISRLVVMMFVVALLTARNVLIENLNKPSIKKMMIFWLGIAFVLSCYHFFRGEAFGTPRTIFVSLLYIVIVPWSNIDRQKVLLAILFGGIVAGALSIYEHEVLNVRRVGGIINQIPFALYAAMTLLIAIYSLKKYQQNRMILFTCISILGSFSAIIMSEVRGIWLSMLCVTILFIATQVTKSTARKVTMTTVLTLLALLVLSTTNEVNRRIDETKNEFISIANGNKDTSIGIRLQLWHSAIDIIKANPLAGVGTKGYQQIMEHQYKQGLITKTALTFKNAHYHNQYLDSYVRYGLIGLTIAILMCISPFVLYRNSNADLMKLVLAISVLLLVAGFTDVPFIHTGIIYMLVIYPAAIAMET